MLLQPDQSCVVLLMPTLNKSVWVLSYFWQTVAEQVQEGQEHSKAAAANHDLVLQQLSAEHAHTTELDSQIETQHKVCLCVSYSAHLECCLLLVCATVSGIVTSAGCCLYVPLSQASLLLQATIGY